ncbi:hypothetical protein C7271_11120 [filamentous cyanobacterium CCP5]|nr:hypothetical protein C7271_11120 [filamentous cyanobacterium CCP5]
MQPGIKDHLADFQQQLDFLRYRARHATTYLERKNILMQISLLHRSAESPADLSEKSDRG